MVQNELYPIFLKVSQLNVLIIGGGITRYFGFEGSTQIRQGESSNVFYISEPHLYIQATDNKQHYSVDRPISLGTITDNSFHIRIASKKGPIDIDYKDYIKNAVETILENGKIKYVPGEEGNHGLRVLILDITFNGKKQEVSVLGGPGYHHNYHKFGIDNIALQIAFGNKKVALPFSIHLNKFMLDRYPGSNIPSSVASEITLTDNRNGLSKAHRISINNVLRYTRPGSILVFHDSVKASENLYFTLPRILEELKNRGFKFKAIH